MAACLLALAGCVSYDGSGLLPGTSRMADVEASMGVPDDKRATAGGGSLWFYTRPSGGHTFAVQFGPDGVLRRIESALTDENIAKLTIGVSRREDVRALLGPPHVVLRLDRQQREVWEYKRLEVTERRVLWVQFSDDGVAREIFDSLDYDYVPASDSGLKD